MASDLDAEEIRRLLALEAQCHLWVRKKYLHEQKVDR